MTGWILFLAELLTVRFNWIWEGLNMRYASPQMLMIVDPSKAERATGQRIVPRSRGKRHEVAKSLNYPTSDHYSGAV